MAHIEMAAEPAAALLSEEVSRSGLLGQVMRLSNPDKVALIRYLNQDVASEDPFQTDEFGRIRLTREMREAVSRAERDLDEGCCFGDAAFNERFAKWL